MRTLEQIAAEYQDNITRMSARRLELKQRLTAEPAQSAELRRRITALERAIRDSASVARYLEDYHGPGTGKGRGPTGFLRDDWTPRLRRSGSDEYLSGLSNAAAVLDAAGRPAQRFEQGCAGRAG